MSPFNSFSQMIHLRIKAAAALILLLVTGLPSLLAASEMPLVRDEASTAFMQVDVNPGDNPQDFVNRLKSFSDTRGFAMTSTIIEPDHIRVLRLWRSDLRVVGMGFKDSPNLRFYFSNWIHAPCCVATAGKDAILAKLMGTPSDEFLDGLRTLASQSTGSSVMVVENKGQPDTGTHSVLAAMKKVEITMSESDSEQFLNRLKTFALSSDFGIFNSSGRIPPSLMMIMYRDDLEVNIMSGAAGDFRNHDIYYHVNFYPGKYGADASKACNTFLLELVRIVKETPSGKIAEK